MALTPEEAALLARLQANAGGAPAAAPVANGWGAPAPAASAMPTPLGVLVPVELKGGDGGRVEVYIQFGPEFAAPQALVGLLSSLAASGIPLKVWKPKSQFGGGSGGGGFGGGRGW